MGKNIISDEKKVVVKSMVDAGMTYREVQKILPISLGYISSIVKEFGSNNELVTAYKNNRADILAHDQLTYRSHITPEKLEKASARELELMRCMAYDKERLERGESTENIAHIHKVAKQIRDKRRGIT